MKNFKRFILHRLRLPRGFATERKGYRVDSLFKANNSHKGSEGFIALVSVIIITAILFAIVLTLSFSSFLVRSNILESEYKDRSYGLAETCANIAILKLSLDPSYMGNETDTSVPCFIDQITGGTQKVIRTHSEVSNYSTNFRVTVSGSGPALSIVSWEETPNL